MKALSARIRVNQPGRRFIIDPRCPFPHSAYVASRDRRFSCVDNDELIVQIVALVLDFCVR